MQIGVRRPRRYGCLAQPGYGGAHNRCPPQESFVFCLGLQSLVALSAGAPGPATSAEEAPRHSKEEKCTTKTLEAEGLYFYIAPAFTEAPTTAASSACTQARY